MNILALLIALTFYSISYAGPGHGHSHGHEHSKMPALNEVEAQEAGKSHVDRLIKSKKIDASWGEAVFDKAKMKKFGKKKEWIITFTNEKGVKGKKLFIFLKPSGEFVAANFTGK